VFGVIDAQVELDKGTRVRVHKFPTGGRRREERAASCALPFTGSGRDLVNEHRMSNRSTIVMAAVTLGALALSTAVLIGAFVVVDRRAAQVLQSESQIAPAEKKGARSAGSSRMTTPGGDHPTDRGAPASGPRSPAPTNTQTVGSAAGAGTAGPPPATPQSSAGETTPVPDTKLDSGHRRRAEARHRGRRHGRHWARSSREQQDGGEATGSAQGIETGGQSGFFFPFR